MSMLRFNLFFCPSSQAHVQSGTLILPQSTNTVSQETTFKLLGVHLLSCIDIRSLVKESIDDINVAFLSSKHKSCVANLHKAGHIREATEIHLTYSSREQLNQASSKVNHILQLFNSILYSCVFLLCFFLLSFMQNHLMHIIDK